MKTETKKQQLINKKQTNNQTTTTTKPTQKNQQLPKTTKQLKLNSQQWQHNILATYQLTRISCIYLMEALVTAQQKGLKFEHTYNVH